MIIPVWHALFINEMPIWPKFATEICERHGVLQQEINWLIAKQIRLNNTFDEINFQ